MRLILSVGLLLCVAGCHQSARESSSATQASPPTGEGIKGVHRNSKGKIAPGAPFETPEGTPTKLSSLKGTPVLVNLWAAWCTPCVKELPTLDRLARTKRVSVLAISEDNAPRASVVAFFKAHGIATLKPYQDPNMNILAALGPDTVLPTSILIDADGKEVWRYVGDLDWSSPEAAKLLAEAPARAPRG